MRLAIHQPEYLPCLALVAKAARVDRLVLLDDCQFNRDSLQQRARIAGPAGDLRWLTIPFKHGHPQRICDVIAAGEKWGEKHAAIARECYAGLPGWPEIAADLGSIWDNPVGRVADNVAASMEIVFAAFGVAAPEGATSSLHVGGQKGDRVLAICKALGARTYVCGRGGAGYLDADAFRAAGVEIEVSTFAPVGVHRAGLPEDAYAKGLSALDVWAHLGGDGARAWFRRELARESKAA